MLAERIEKEYTNKYSDIDREVFDKILAMDPSSSIEQDKIGEFAKQLLLPMYQNGETAFVDDAENVTKAITMFIEKRKNNELPNKVKNLSRGPFPSVKDFVEYMFLGDESNFAKNYDLTDGEEKQPKESPLDIIYNKYYTALPREEFNRIISLDPETTEKSIGSTAKNFLLVRALKGEKIPDEVTAAIAKYNEEKDTYPEDKKSIQNFESVADFIKFINEGPETEFVTRLKNCEYVDPTTHRMVKDDIQFIGATRKFDILHPLSWSANRAISSNLEFGSPRNKYFTWCTGWEDDGQWRNHQNEWIYCFINKDYPAPRTEQKKALSYQLSITKSGYRVYQFLDGNDKAYGEFNASRSECEPFFRDFLNANPDVALILAKTEYIKENNIVKEVAGNLKYKDRPFIYDGPDSLIEFKNYNLKAYCKEIICKNVEIIPAGAFAECAALEKVTLNEGLKVIEAEAFMKDMLLNNLQLPSTLESIGAEAFANCTNLTNTIRIPDSLTNIGRNAFRATRCKLSINAARTTKLKADPADLDWFRSHAKAITVQEGLEENMNNDLLEDVLDENIPPDLARAYKQSNRVSYPETHTWSNHREIDQQRYNTRRNVTTDYKNSNYEQISKDEAIQYLAFQGYKVKKDSEGNPILDTNGKYQIGGRMSSEDRAIFTNNLTNLRFLVKGADGKQQVAEFEIQGTNILKPVYVANVAQSEFGNYPFFNGNSTTSTGSLHNYGDFYILIQVSDKIYKTDEYQHKITPETPTGKKVKLLRKDPNGNPVRDEDGNLVYDIVDDTIFLRRNRNKGYQTLQVEKPKLIKNNAGQWVLDPNYVLHSAGSNLKTLYAPKVLDTGSHRKDFANPGSNMDFSNYVYADNDLKNAFKKYDYMRNYIKKVESQREYYDEEEYNTLINQLNTKKQDLYNAYITASDNVKKAKQKLILSVDDITLDFNKRFVAEIKDLTKQLQDLYNINQEQASELLNVSVINAAEKEQLEKQIKDSEQAIQNERANIEAFKQQKQELLNQIQELERKIEQGGIDLEQAIQKLGELTSQIADISTTVMKKKFEKVDELESRKADIQARLDQLAPRAAADKAARAAKNRQKDLDPRLVNILDFGTTNSETVEQPA